MDLSLISTPSKNDDPYKCRGNRGIMDEGGDFGGYGVCSSTNSYC